MPDFNYLEFFKEEIRNESAAIKITAVSRLNLIASALGPQKTVNELIPFVIEVVQEAPLCYDEEFLFNTAKQYAILSEYIDGQYYEHLVPPLEHLAAQEETVIRDQAIASLCTIVQKRPKLVPEFVVPTLHRLAKRTDFFTARVSACALLPTTYKYASDDQKPALRKVYTTLCADDTPMVRRAAAQKLRDFVSECDKPDLLADIMGVYKQLSQEDTQDTIRVACVHTTLVIARLFNAEENRQHTVQVIQEAVEDRSWRVRLMVAKNFDQLCEAFGPDIMNTHLMKPLNKLTKDNEQEVRKEAVRIIQACLELKHPMTNEQLATHILPTFSDLANDSAQIVRAALAQVMGPVAKVLGCDVTQRQLLTIISDLMRDEFHDVRLNIVSHAGLICEVLSPDGLVHSLLHTISNLIMDNHWRIRQSVVEQVPKLAKLFGVEMFVSKLEALFLSSLRDSVHCVRHSAIVNTKDIAAAFGPQWTMDHLLPKLVEHYSQSSGYANRVTTLHVLVQVTTVMPPDQIVRLVLPNITKALKDSVPNVRFCACKQVMWIVENQNLGAAVINNAIKPALLELKSDSDIDVKYYAEQALEKC